MDPARRAKDQAAWDEWQLQDTALPPHLEQAWESRRLVPAAKWRNVFFPQEPWLNQHGRPNSPFGDVHAQRKWQWSGSATGTLTVLPIREEDIRRQLDGTWDTDGGSRMTIADCVISHDDRRWCVILEQGVEGCTMHNNKGEVLTASLLAEHQLL